MKGPGKGKKEKRGKEGGGGAPTRQGKAMMGSAGRCFQRTGWTEGSKTPRKTHEPQPLLGDSPALAKASSAFF